MRCWTLAPLVWAAKGVARLPQAALLALGGALAVLLSPLLGSRRRVARANIALCFPELDATARERLLRANLRDTVTGALELLRAWYAPASSLPPARITGLALLRDTLATGQGVLLFTGHFTHTELAVRLLGEALGRRLGGVVRHNNDECLETEFARARASVFGTTLEKKDLRGLLRALQGGEAIVYSADQNFTYQHAFVPFFGVPAATLTTTPQLVERGRARMLPLFFHRADDGAYEIEVREAWPGWQQGAPEDAAAIYMRELEAYVRRHPSQYLWVHRRYKTRPPGEVNPYS